jgi:hypothetical protein
MPVHAQLFLPPGSARHRASCPGFHARRLAAADAARLATRTTTTMPTR